MRYEYQYHFRRELTTFSLFYFISRFKYHLRTQLLYGNVGAIAVVAALYGADALEGSSTSEYEGYIYVSPRRWRQSEACQKFNRLIFCSLFLNNRPPLFAPVSPLSFLRCRSWSSWLFQRR
jgi:hypothetical protein